MDTVCHKKRVQDTISCPSLTYSGGTFLSEDISQRSREDSTSQGRSRIDAGKTGHRASYFSASEKRLLQPSVSGSQEIGRLEACDRPFPTKSVHSDSSFQNGNFGFSSSCLTEGRLGHLTGSERCVLPHTHPSKVQEISSFPFYGDNIPVPGVSFRSGPSPLCLYSCSQDGGQVLPLPRAASPCLFGRLATAISISGSFSVQQRITSENCSTSGICSQLGQIRAGSQSDFLFPGGSVRFSAGSYRPFLRSNFQTADFSRGNVSSSFSLCSSDSFSARSDGICITLASSRSCSQEITSVAPQRSLVSIGTVVGLSHIPRSMVPASSITLAGQRLPVFSCSSIPAKTRLLSLHGCQSGRLGGSPGRSFGIGPMVCSLEGTTHQCSRTQSSLASSEILLSGSFRQPHFVVNRQHNCGSLLEQRRGGTFSDSVLHGYQAPSMVCQTTGVSDSPVRTREVECSCRFPFEERADNSYRVDSSYGHSVSDISFLGSSSHRPVCHQVEQSTSSFCISSSGPSSLGSGCHVPVMGRDVSVCFSSLPSSVEGSTEDREGELPGNSDSSSLGEPSIFSHSDVSVGCSSNPASMPQRSLVSTSLSSGSSQTRGFQSARLFVLQRGLEKAGFSRKSAKRVCSAKRASTQNLYDYRWNTWMDWCLQRQMDPIDPSVALLADFLIFLFEEKKLSPVSIKGYRSAISSTLKHFSSVDFSSDPVLSDIVRSMELEKPMITRVVPNWDLSLVLSCFKKSPFEPLSSCSLKLLTLKTVFLIALASGRRRSEIHALSATSGSVDFSADKSSVILHSFPGFLAKNQVPSLAGTPIEIPALPSENSSDSSLCPVRALRIYLSRTKNFRRGRNRLFISFVKGYTKEISASTISRWIVDSVRFAYSQSSSCSASKVCAHELRALSTSWAWLNHVPLDRILRAGFWRSDNSFIRFYLRDTSGQNQRLFSLGPIVAAQSVISSH